MNKIDSITPKLKPKRIHTTELLWTPIEPSNGKFKRCCFCVADWLIFFVSAASIVLSVIVFFTIVLAQSALRRVSDSFSFHKYEKHDLKRVDKLIKSKSEQLNSVTLRD